MGAAVGITRDEHNATSLRTLARRTRDAAQARRLLAIAMILEGASRQDATRQAGMDRQTLCDWVHRYNESGIEGLAARKSSGAPPKLTEAQMQGIHPARDMFAQTSGSATLKQVSDVAIFPTQLVRRH
jgi:transposase